MRSLYACIEINRTDNKLKSRITEKIQYYKTKKELYGIEVIKENNCYNKEISNVFEITDNEEEIDSILDILVNNVVMYNFEDIINDLLRNRITI